MPHAGPPHDRAPDGAVTVETDVPARLDRLPWSAFHSRIVLALGITWVLDGLEVTLAGSVAGALKASAVLRLSNSDIGLAGSAYILGAVVGALLFGWLADRLGRRKLFFVTLSVYVAATAATALSWNLASFIVFRALTGAGIGGEYAAINSAIQEFTPARVRGRTDLAINGTFWVGAAFGALVSIVLLDPARLGGDAGWRACFMLGAVLGLGILLMRAWVPESPRWLLTHGHAAQASKVVDAIEQPLLRKGVRLPVAHGTIRLRTGAHGVTWRRALATMFGPYRRRSLVGLVLMTAQAFFYNAIFFTYALVLTDFYGVPATRVGWYVLPFAAGNVLGPLVLGRWFDTLGRRVMIAFTYAVSGALLAGSGWLFAHGLLNSVTQTLAWTVIFFFASAAASSAYLTVSETFPLEVRALAIAVFYAIGTGAGGVVGPALLGWLIDTHRRDAVFHGYLLGAVLMVVAAVVAALWGTDAERKSLEAVARPLSSGDIMHGDTVVRGEARGDEQRRAVRDGG